MKSLILTLVGVFSFLWLQGQMIKPMVKSTTAEVAGKTNTTTDAQAQSVWQKVYQLPLKQEPYSIDVVDEKTVWIYSIGYTWTTPPVTESYLFRSIDGGTNWTPIEFQKNIQFSAIDSLHVWASMKDVGIIRTSDGGRNWDTLFVTDRFGPVHFYNENNGLFIGHQNMNNAWDNGDSIVIYRTTNGGVDWNIIDRNLYSGTSPGEMLLRTNYESMVANDSLLMFGTVLGRIFTTMDMGETWSVSPSVLGENEIITGLLSNTPDHLVITTGGHVYGIGNFTVRDYPIIASTTDDGANWKIRSCLDLSVTVCMANVPGSDSLVFLSGYEYNYGSGGTMISHDYGLNFKLIDSTSNIQVMQFYNDQTGFAASFNNNDNRFADINYILKWIPGNYNEVDPWKKNLMKPDSCIWGVTDEEIGLILPYPNPTSGLCYIDLRELFLKNGHLAVFDFLGRQVLTKNVILEGNNKKVEVDLSGMPDGIYLVQLKIGNRLYCNKIILSKTN